LEAEEIISWLNSLEGRKWSRSVHKQAFFQTHLFTIKEDVEIVEKEWIRYYGAYDCAGRFRKPRVKEKWPKGKPADE
jgi:hypothetical protein